MKHQFYPISSIHPVRNKHLLLMGGVLYIHCYAEIEYGQKLNLYNSISCSLTPCSFNLDAMTAASNRVIEGCLIEATLNFPRINDMQALYFLSRCVDIISIDACFNFNWKLFFSFTGTVVLHYAPLHCCNVEKT